MARLDRVIGIDTMESDGPVELVHNAQETMPHLGSRHVTT
jgi:hypothetical protein